MTNQNDHTDEVLQKLYRQRKAEHKAPLSIKRYILAKQHDNQTIQFIYRRMGYVAVAASTLLLISLLLIQRSEQRPEASYQLVQMHTLDNPTAPQAKAIKHRYARHYEEYLAQRTVYLAHHKTRARLNFLENGWQLTSCDNEIMQLSADLVTALSNIQQIDAQLTTGDIVEIAFDQTGIILGITRSGNYLTC